MRYFKKIYAVFQKKMFTESKNCNFDTNIGSAKFSKFGEIFETQLGNFKKRVLKSYKLK